LQTKAHCPRQHKTDVYLSKRCQFRLIAEQPNEAIQLDEKTFSNAF